MIYITQPKVSHSHKLSSLAAAGARGQGDKGSDTRAALAFTVVYRKLREFDEERTKRSKQGKDRLAGNINHRSAWGLVNKEERQGDGTVRKSANSKVSVDIVEWGNITKWIAQHLEAGVVLTRDRGNRRHETRERIDKGLVQNSAARGRQRPPAAEGYGFPPIRSSVQRADCPITHHY